MVSCAAIAPDPAHAADPRLGKQALLPGQAASFQNCTSYSRGINGISLCMRSRITALTLFMPGAVSLSRARLS